MSGIEGAPVLPDPPVLPAQAAKGPLELLREVAALALDTLPPEREVLPLLFAAVRLRDEDSWGPLEVFHHEPMGLWALRGEHFLGDALDTCRTEVVVPVGVNDTLSIERHEALARGLGQEAIFYALVDADGTVVLYELRPAPLMAPPGQRPLSEPAYVPPVVLAEVAKSAAKEEGTGATDAQATAGAAATRERGSKRKRAAPKGAS
mmetsp:Transcript_91646/g.204588  ORF Transcript_91646/g.204588 Transcript_91646/m.204588 type:complete len:206 (-) Transcript_91646:127-744(-)